MWQQHDDQNKGIVLELFLPRVTREDGCRSHISTVSTKLQHRLT